MSIKRQNVFSIIETILTKDPSASYWLKNALKEALCLDPEDVANDADYLASILKMRCEAFNKINRYPKRPGKAVRPLRS